VNFWSAHNPHASSLKIREVWCLNLNLSYRVRSLLHCRLRHGVASCIWNALLWLSLCTIKQHVSNWAKGHSCWLPSAFHSFVFHLLFVGSSEHSGLWYLKKAEKASGARLVFLCSLPSFVRSSRIFVVGVCAEFKVEPSIIFWHFETPSTSSFRTYKNFVILLSGIPASLAWIGQHRQKSAEKARNIFGTNASVDVCVSPRSLITWIRRWHST
jgi:hypothetical protein